MISSTSIRFVIGIIMLLLLSIEVSSFLPSAITVACDHASPSRGYHVNGYTHCYLTPKRNSDKASQSTNKINGIGGLNVGNSPLKTKKTRDVNNTKPKDVIINKPLNKKILKNPSNNEASDPTMIPWSKIILAFLIPWRNPNSLFLYMLLIVSVLGKLNEHPH